HRLKQILLQEEPTKSVGHLPELMNDIKVIIQRETDNQKNAVVIQSDKLMEELSELLDQYTRYETITEYIESKTNQANQLRERIEESEHIASARINQQQLSELIDHVKLTSRKMLIDLMKESNVVKREPKPLSEKELYQTFFSQVDTIETEEDLEHAIDLLKEKLLKELQTHY